MNFLQVVELITLNTIANLLCFVFGHILAKPWLDRHFAKKAKQVAPAPGQPQIP